MAGETIELLKNYTPTKMPWPAAFQQKHDGVPTRVVNQGGDIVALSRQGEVFRSIDHIREMAKFLLLVDGASITMELIVPGMAFKDISGKVRDTKQQHPDLIGMVFDADLMARPDMDWASRYDAFTSALTGFPSLGPIRRNPSIVVANAAGAEKVMQIFMQKNPQAEGAVLHSTRKPFQPGKRCWGTQRMKARETVDLAVLGFEEAVAEDGTPKGMVGRINCRLDRVGRIPTTIGVGPGKLDHNERRRLWDLYKLGKTPPGLIAEVLYMPDPTYDALRQPTFQRWRPDKVEADILD